MLLAERKKKLVYAEKQLKATQRRLKRLMTAQKNWQNKVTYHRTKFEWETQVEAATKVVAPVPEFGIKIHTGRKFR